MHEFQTDFYGREMRAVVLGYIRPELDYISRGKLESPLLNLDQHSLSEALIEDIETDKKVALNCLQRPGYQKYANEAVFQQPSSEVKASM